MMASTEKRSRMTERFFLLLAAVFALLHAVPYFYEHSLWLDEAMLASSVVTRPLPALTASSLDWGQSAPVGYLYIVKLLTLALGKSETVLRLFSLIAFFLCVPLVYALLRDGARVRRPAIFTAVFALLPFYFSYANQVKQYMADNLFVLLSLWLYVRYRQGKLPLWRLAICDAVILWFSFASVFYIAGCMILTVIPLLIKLFSRKKRGGESVGTIFGALCLCALTAISFALNYFLWLGDTGGNAGGSGFWDILAFPLLPVSRRAVQTLIAMLPHFMSPLETLVGVGLTGLLALGGLIVFLRRREGAALWPPILVGTALLLFASWLGFYPIMNRLVQFIPILLLLLAARGFDALEERFAPKKWGAVLLAAVFLALAAVPAVRSVKECLPERVFISGSEVERNMELLREKRGDEWLYLGYYAIPVYGYETDYAAGRADIGDDYPLVSGSAHVIFGQESKIYDYEKPYSYAGHINEDAVQEDLRTILAHESCWLLSTHEDEGFARLTEELAGFGTVELVCNEWETPLYHFVKAAQG